MSPFGRFLAETEGGINTRESPNPPFPLSNRDLGDSAGQAPIEGGY